MPRFLLLLDTPGIKQFVFGTDPLAEIRGASALLDRLNRIDTERELAARLHANGARLERVVYANGGSGQVIVEAGAAARHRRGYVGLVYADGNAMGRLVQELDSVDTCAAFSRIVDESIRAACHQALTAGCAGEIAAVRKALAQGLPFPALPA